MDNGQKSIIILTYHCHKLLDLDSDYQNNLSIWFPFTLAFSILTSVGSAGRPASIV
jgi:hypothetical protein